MARLTKPKITLDLPQPIDPTRGGGGWPLTVDGVENYAWKQDVFTDEEMDAIIQIGEASNLETSRTFAGFDSKTRHSSTSFLFPSDLTNWVFARIAGVVSEINDSFFGFDLSGIDEGLQFTRYVAPGEHYDWHVDRSFLTRTRKLSVSIQLSNPDDYSGGNLQFKFGPENTNIIKQRGMATIFPSYTLHRVRPVTKGTRYSLVAWIGGPDFK